MKAMRFMNARFFRQALPQLLLLPVVAVALLVCILAFQIRSLESSAAWVDHTDLVIARMNKLTRLMIDKETGIRGYLLTGRKEFLEPYDRAKREINFDFQQLQNLVNDPMQVERLRKLSADNDAWEELAAGRLSATTTHEQLVVDSLAAKARMDQIREESAQFLENEEALRARSSSRAQFLSRLTYILLLLLSSLAATSIFIFTYKMFHKSARMQADREWKALQKSEQHFRALFENMLEGFAYCEMVFDKEGHPVDFVYLETNSAFAVLTGLGNVVGKNVTEIYPGIGESQPELFEIYGRVVLTGKPERFESELKSLGTWFSISVYRPTSGHFVLVFDNITERKRTEEALHESEERFRIMADGCPTAMWVTNAEGGNQFVNRAYREFFGITFEEAEDGKWRVLVHPDDTGNYTELFERAVQEHTTFKAEARVRGAGGEWRWVASYAEPRWSSRGEFLGHVGLSPDITKRKQAEQKLQFQHSLIRAIQEVSLDGILVVNDDRLVVSHNQRLQDVLQISMDQVLDNGPNHAPGSPDQPMLSAFLERVKDPGWFLTRVQELYGDPEAKEHCEIAMKDDRTLELYSTDLRSEGNEYLGRVWFVRDITARKQAEHDLRSSEEKFRQLAENIHEVIWMVPKTANEKPYVSPAYEQIWGRTCESLYKNPMSWVDAIHPDDLRDNHLLFAAEMKGESTDFEFRIRTPDGREKWIRDRAFPIHDEAGHLIRVVGIAEEITERKRSEVELAETNRALATSEARYRKLIDLSPNAIIVGKNNAIVLANQAAVELFGVASAKDLIGGRFQDLVRPEARSGTEKIIQRMYECEMQLPLQEGQVRRTDGSLLDVDVAASSFSESGGGVVQAVIQNITQRKQAEAENARLIRSIEQVGESVVITDLEASILYVNPAFEKITGYSRAEALGNNPRLLKSDRHPASFYQAMWATLLRGETWYGELINKRKDGSLFNEEATISPIKTKDGKVINYVAVKRDITKDLLLRDQLNQSQKMEAVGSLAGGIAHDFNNLLMVIQSYTEMLQERLPIRDILRNNTEQILKAAERGASLTGQMLAFSRKQVISTVVLDLNAAIEETVKMLKRVIGEDIEFQVVSAKSLWAIEADPDQIVQVLMNLCVNSRDAMPQGGALTIKTGNVTVANGSVVGHPCVYPGDYVMLSVTDTGTGISKELQARIFEPFFTTKEVGKGTGLGLATVYGIVKQSGGYVWIDSEAGQGACFTIYFPKIERPVARNNSAKSDASPRGTETLLVVEDEEFIREAICEFLRSLGYTVYAAGSGQQALLVASQQEHLDLLLTDVVMPKMSGRELSQMLGSLRPNMKVIHMSGYTDDTVLQYGIHESGATFLQKPFSLGTLARKVRDTLERDDLKSTPMTAEPK